MEIDTQPTHSIYPTYDKGAKGLPNIGNTCYMNSALQCMINNPVFKNYFRTRAYEKHLDHSKDQHLLLLQFKDLYDAYWVNGDFNAISKAISTFHALANMIATKQGVELYQVGRQNDVHEFLQFLINSLHEAVAYPILVTIKGTVVNELDALEVKAKTEWGQSHLKSYSQFVEMCSGQLRSQVVCPTCTNSSDSYTPECTFSLEFPPQKKGPVSLYDCLDQFARTEVLGANDMVTCEKCVKKVQAQKQMYFWRMPEVFIVLIKRFDNAGRKINTPVDYPMSLDLRKYCGGYDTKIAGDFRLTGVCNHSGDVGGGHYYAYANGGNGWKKYNDSSVSELTDKEVTSSQAAYCLFYTRSDKL